MKKTSFALALSLSLFACGTQEKAENPFGKKENKSTDEERTVEEFQKDCGRKNGEFRNNGTLCRHVKHKFQLSEKQKEEVHEKGMLLLPLGNVTPGAVLWGEVKGGQPVIFKINDAYFTSMTDKLTGVALIPGHLSIRIDAGQYEYVRAYVAECFTRTSPTVPCPLN